MTRLTYLFFLTFSICLCFSSCSKDDNDDTQKEQEEEKEEEMNEEPLSLVSACKYEIVLGDITIANDPNDEWLYCATNRNTTSDTIGFIDIPGASIDDDDNNFYLYLSRGLLRVDGYDDVPDNADFEALFQTGTYELTRRDNEGIQLEYGVNGELWSSDNGYDGFEQSGSTFTILEMVSGESGGAYYVSIRGEFSCNMYNQSGEMRTSTGKLTVQFQNF